MDLYKLRCFVTVVEKGSITKAAEFLNMTQPPLSTLIRKLENELNVSLFSRSVNRRLRLTKSGEILYERALKILSLAEEIKMELTEHENGIRGTINIGCATSPSYLLMPEIVKKLREIAPNIIIKNSEGPASFIFKELKNNNFDIGIVPVIYEAEDYEIIPLYTDQLLVVVPSKHPLAKKDSINLTDLKNENFLLTNTSIGQSISDQIIELCQLNGFTPKTVYWGTDTIPMIHMVIKGIGIAFMPSNYKKFHLFQKSIKEKKIFFKKIDSHELQIKYSLVFYKNHYKSKLIEKFIKIAKEVASSFNNDD